MFRKKSEDVVISPNRKAEKDGVIELIECPNCHRKVEHIYFKCIRCGVTTCAFCGKHTTIPSEVTPWCYDCYDWVKGNVKKLIEKKFGGIKE